LIDGWADEVNCADVDPDLFFDERREAAAAAVCRGCPALKRCLEFALMSQMGFGVWGGLTARQRRRLQRQRWAG